MLRNIFQLREKLKWFTNDNDNDEGNDSTFPAFFFPKAQRVILRLECDLINEGKILFLQFILLSSNSSPAGYLSINWTPHQKYLEQRVSEMKTSYPLWSTLCSRNIQSLVYVRALSVFMCKLIPTSFPFTISLK